MRLSGLAGSVDLPQPDGPMKAVISRSGISRLISVQGVEVAVMQVHVLESSIL